MQYGSTTMADQPTRASTVEFDRVTKRYDADAKNTPGAVNDLSLQVPAGKICVLVGPSGCGKTTSLKMVNRLIEPTSGGSSSMARTSPSTMSIDLRRSIGYVIQQTGLFPTRRSARTSRRSPSDRLVEGPPATAGR